MRLIVLAAAMAVGVMALPGVGTAAQRELIWLNGKVMSIIHQQPSFTSANVGGKSVRFCHPTSGKDLVITSDYLQYDMLRSALLTGKSVQVGVYDLGFDPRTNAVKLCIDRVILQE